MLSMCSLQGGGGGRGMEGGDGRESGDLEENNSRERRLTVLGRHILPSYQLDVTSCIVHQ